MGKCYKTRRRILVFLIVTMLQTQEKEGLKPFSINPHGEGEGEGEPNQESDYRKLNSQKLPFSSAESDAMESARRGKHKLLLSIPFQPFKTRSANLGRANLDHRMISSRPLETSTASSANYCCMMMRISVDCKACQTKLRRILLSMKEVETHMIERQFGRVSVCGRFRPSDVAVKVQKGMNRRVGILEIQEFDGQPPYG